MADYTLEPIAGSPQGAGYTLEPVIEPYRQLSTKPMRQYPELAPFPVDHWLNDHVKGLPPDQQVEKKNALTSVFSYLAKPWVDVGYSTISALNRGGASFFDNLDVMSRWVERQGGGTREGFFENMAKSADKRADYWKEQADKNGAGFLEELVGDAVGSAVPGITDFALKVASGFSIPAVVGVEKAVEHETDPFIGGLVEAAKTATLSSMFKMFAPFSRYLQATMMSMTFGAQDAVEAPSGERLKAFAKGAGTGALYGLTSPSGNIRLRDLLPEIGSTVPEIRQELSGEPQQEAQKEPVREEPAPQEKPPEQATKAAEPLTADSYKSEADRLGLIFNGMQERVNKPPMPLFTDKETKATFALLPESGKTVEEALADKRAQFEKRGPGAAAAGQNFDPDIADLTEQLQTIPKDTSFEDRTNIADKLKKTYTGTLGTVKTAWSGFKSTSAAAWDWYKRPPQFGTFDKMFGEYLGSREMSGMKTDAFAKQIQKSMPERKQIAIANYMRSGPNGDEQVLRDWLDQTIDPELKRGYEDAITLTTEEKAFATNIRQYWDTKLDEAIKEGVLEHGVEFYVRQILEKNPNDQIAQRLASQSNAGMLRKNPAFAKKQIFHSFFEGEQAGYRYEKRIGYLISEYQQSFDEAIAARSFIRQLTNGDGSDGRPLAVTLGSGHPIPKGEEQAEAYLINPRAVTEKITNPATGEKEYLDTTGYGTIDHPALRKYKWATKDNDGNPIFVQGDLLIHPDAYKKMDALLSRSAIQDNPIGKAALKASSEVKGTLLGFFSTFHQVGLGQHLLTHGVNPFAPPKIDLGDTLTQDLINHNLKVYDGNALSNFREGLTGPGLIKYIPGLGPYAEKYTEYLFGNNGYIPRAKMTLAKTLFERNTERYPDLSRDQVLKLSADQTNAALGGQYYRAMGRSKTMQDALRLGGLAPDFLESRIRFTGQAFSPYGREQFTALAIRGALGMYVLAKTIEGIASLVDDKNSVHWKRPFSVTIDDKEYTLRSMQGDIWHLVTDPRSFAYYRLNPFIAKPAIEALTGRDNWGKKRDIQEQIKDWATTAVPIAGQGFFNKEDYSLYQSILQSLGVSSWNSRTEAEKLVREIQGEKSKEVLPPVMQERMKLRGKLGEEFAKTGDLGPVRKAIAEGKITPKDLQPILDRAIKGDVARGVSGFSVPDALRVWDAATDDEKAMIQPMIIRKWAGWQATVEERMAFEKQMEDVLKWKPSEPIKKKRFSIRNQ